MRRLNIPKEELIKLYRNGKLTTYQIAEKFGCCQGTIWKRLVEFRVKRRKPHELYSKIPLKEELIKLYTKNKLSTWKIEKRYGYCRGPVHRKLKEYRIRTRDRATSHIIYHTKNFTGNLIEKAYLIGFRIGDLRVRKKYPNSKVINVDCGSTKYEQINLIKKLFVKYGHIWIGKPTKSGKIQIEASLNDSFSFLLKKETPKWISKNKKYFFSFLAGFTDAEGNIGIYNKQATFQIGNYDKTILSLILRKLNEFGVICRGPYESDTSNYIHREGYKYNQNYFQIRVGKKDALVKLFNSLRPYLKHRDKIKALKKAEDNIIKRNLVHKGKNER